MEKTSVILIKIHRSLKEQIEKLKLFYLGFLFDFDYFHYKNYPDPTTKEGTR